MGSVIGISNTHIRAVEGAEIPTLKVSGIVGEDFTGSFLADELVSAAGQVGEVRMLIDSVGGSASNAFAFYDTIRVAGIKLWVDGRGTVASAATIMMAAAGRKRSRLFPNAKYLVHNATGDDASAVANANVQMQNIYMDLTGMGRGEIKALMAEDRLLNAQEALSMRFVGSVVELQKLAAHADNTITMADEKGTKRVFAVDRDKALAAMVTGHIEIDMAAADSELKTQLDSAVTDLTAANAKIADLEASAKTAPDAVKTAVEAAEKALKEQHAKDLTTLAGETDKLKAKIAELEKTPAVAAVKAAGTSGVVDPEETKTLAERFPKLTAEQKEAAFNKAKAGRNKVAA